MLGLLLAVLLVEVAPGCTDGEAGERPVASATSAPAVSAVPVPVDQQQVFDETVAENSAAATAWAEQLLDSVIVPRGATRLHREPRIFGRGGRPFVCLTDRLLEQVGWWVVDGGIRDVSRFLVEHVPEGLHNPRSGIRREVGWPYVDLHGRSPQPDAFTDPCVGLEVRQSGPQRTFIRATTHLQVLGTRDPAAVLVPPVSRVVVHLGELAGRRSMTRTLRWTGGQPDARRLIEVVDGLRASAVPNQYAGSCPYTSAATTIRLRIADAGGTWRGVLRGPYCGGQLVVTRNGEPVVGTLDPGGVAELVYPLFS